MYAERYPEQLKALRNRFAEDESKVRAVLPELPAAADKLSGSEPGTLVELVRRADAEGRSSAYAEGSLEAETVSRFMSEERQPLHQKVAGSVSYTAKEKGCNEELGGAAAGAMDRAVEKQLEERLVQRGTAQRFIEDHENAIPKNEQEGAGELAGSVAALSHISHVRLELHRRELERALQEASRVQSTLERTERESSERLADAKASKPAKVRAEKRKAAAGAARAALSGEVEQAKQALDDMQQRQKKLASDYDQALAALVQRLEQRQKR